MIGKQGNFLTCVLEDQGRRENPMGGGVCSLQFFEKYLILTHTQISYGSMTPPTPPDHCIPDEDVPTPVLRTGTAAALNKILETINLTCI